MNVEILAVKGNWLEVKNSCRTTVNKDYSEIQPNEDWKKRLLLAEHSPIRQIVIKWKWTDIPYATHVHFARHHVGVEKWVSTSRSDRTGTDRAELSQMHPVDMEMEANLQAIINISKKRLCMCAEKTTREAWIMLLKEIKKIMPEVFWACVPECVYRGGCPEFTGCGMYDILYKDVKTNDVTERYDYYNLL